jgi:zinc transport system substrate-binding protein
MLTTFRMRKVPSFILAAMFVCIQPAAAAALLVAVSVPPQAYFVARIGAERVQVQVMMPAGTSHEQYTPSPKQMMALSSARLYVKVGHPALGMEARLIDPFLRGRSDIRVVDMSEGLQFRHMDQHPHQGGGDDADVNDGDPHIWVAPASVRVAARNIAAALTDLDPGHADEYESNLQRFYRDIDVLDGEIRDLLKPLRNRRFMVYHPAWGYFADQYQLQQVAIETGGKTPSAERMVALIDQARREQIHVIFVQKGFATKSAEVIARELRAQVVEVDPLAHDWLENMRIVAQAFREALIDERQ